MSLSILKAGLVAATLVATSAGAAFAAPLPDGTIDHDTKLKAYHSITSPTITWVYEDEDVVILDASGLWFKVRIHRPGPDPVGWVKKSAVDVDYGPSPTPAPGVQACFNGPFGYFCVNGN